MIHLLDGNVVVALVVNDRVHHGAAEEWFGAGRPFATSPITRHVDSIPATKRRRDVRCAGPAPRTHVAFRARLWPDDLSYVDVGLHGVIGHRQVTDAYLAALARARGGRLATFDRGLAALHRDVVTLLGDD